MARPRVSSKPGKSHGSENLTSLSEEVLRLRLQALNLPISGSKAVLVRRLKATTHPRKGITSRPSKTSQNQYSFHKASHICTPWTAGTCDCSSPWSVLFYRMRTPRKSRWRPTPTWMILWWRTSRRQRLTRGIPLPLLATIESTVQSSVDRALQSFSISANLPFMGATPSYGGTQPRRPGTATPLGLHRP